MGEVNGDFDGVLNGDDEQDRVVHEWEEGLPDVDDITPLNHALIPQSLLLAFNIKLDPSRTHGDVIRASEDTLSSIRAQSSGPNSAEGSESKKLRRDESPENAAAPAEEEKSLKRQRLVWTPQLHRRFVDVVGHLGIKNAVPKTIMQLMNVEGLTRENVASHLQKYRLYLKRMQRGTSPETSSPVPEISPEIGGASFPVPYGGTPMVPVMGMGMDVMNYHHHRQHSSHGCSGSSNKQ